MLGRKLAQNHPQYCFPVFYRTGLPWSLSPFCVIFPRSRVPPVRILSMHALSRWASGLCISGTHTELAHS